ncbi:MULTISPECIES: hypothetical protein [unclassified Streptomyces]|uniref:hypothetical protein n=1 Tax=unclassified Streptomyces TaxID=2593676 RepID=UPI002DDBF3DE|nr:MULTISPECIES: hypothetical protein [unclassified Streptomyces]WSF85593.1 hypothetical protein OIE70_22275 [Streptomyces sp. NBC_01744]WSC38116.1 hypothetical protein OHA08_22915 [Streptomyces sp. NBC_01763]WSC46242.1 hypothetical protein OIE61_21100 [Streptomyces sp. NBC_01762]WSC54757.1 hypothetical protein OG808_22180 [Streptomyces sp. NBC_01761]WSD25896.1 hypothetical protein OHA26_21795 [Streptomyces sp. NBC_01751]
MEFHLPGALSVATESGDLPLGPAERRSLLAALLLPSSPATVRTSTPELRNGADDF